MQNSANNNTTFDPNFQIILNDVQKYAKKIIASKNYLEQLAAINAPKQLLISEILAKSDEMVYYFFGIDIEELPLLVICAPNTSQITLYKYPMKTLDDFTEEKVEKLDLTPKGIIEKFEFFCFK